MAVMTRKETRLNIRITPEFRERLEILAEYHGLSFSAYAHSLLVKAVREERERYPYLFPDIIPRRVPKFPDGSREEIIREATGNLPGTQD